MSKPQKGCTIWFCMLGTSDRLKGGARWLTVQNGTPGKL